jgi:3'-5' exoribonuclease
MAVQRCAPVHEDFFISDCSQQENKVIISTFVVIRTQQVKPKEDRRALSALTVEIVPGRSKPKCGTTSEDAIDGFDQDDFVKIKGLINKYKNRFQLTIHKIRRLAEPDIVFGDYLPKTKKNIDELWQTLSAYVAGFQDSNLRTLVQLFMNDPEIAVPYRTAPAAKTLHHAYIGGLLDHVVSLFRSCDLVSQNYPQINRDLLMTGAFLHDIGKIHELTYNRSFSYSTRGQLLGHMIIELEMLQAKIALIPQFPAEMKTLLEHLIISHHGQYEFGSPKLPMFPEALMLHYLDDLDSKMESMRAIFEREADLESPWSSYSPSLGRPLLNSTRFLQKKTTPDTPCEIAEKSVDPAEGNGTHAAPQQTPEQTETTTILAVTQLTLPDVKS